MTSLLARYDDVCRAIAEARTFDAIRDIHDDMEHIKLYGRKIKDRTVVAEATETQIYAEARLGELLIAAEKQGWIREGRHSKQQENGTSPAPFTLQEAGIDKKLSARAQKLAGLSGEELKRGAEAVKARILSGGSMLINGARAIMGSREEPDDSLDFFPTPPWAARALIERVFTRIGRRGDCRRQTVWEPACGEGHIAEVLREYFDTVLASDIHDYGYGAVSDFLDEPLYDHHRADWIITNPPFGDKSEAFLLQALTLAHIGVAIFVRLQWLETEGRYQRIFSVHPPTLIAFFAERVNLCKGRWDPEGGTATAYIWLVWVHGQTPRAPFWIAPGCRKQFSRDGDEERFTQHPVAKRIVMDEPQGEVA